MNRYDFNSSQPTFSLEETEGGSWLNLPVVIGYVFRQGEFTDGIGIETAEGTPIASQMTILRHWNDGSIKHALFALNLDTLDMNEELSFQFVSTPLTTESGVDLSNSARL